jgi:hypothetical protein
MMAARIAPSRYNGRHICSTILSDATGDVVASVWSTGIRRPDHASWRRRSCNTKAMRIGALIITSFISSDPYMDSSKYRLLLLMNMASKLSTRGVRYPNMRMASMVIDVAAAALGFFLVWKICRTVKTHDSVVEATSMMLSKSILDIASDSSSEYIPYKVMSIFSKNRLSVVLSLRLLITPLPWPCPLASREENFTVTSI